MPLYVLWIESVACRPPCQSGFVDAEGDWAFNSLDVAARFPLKQAIDERSRLRGLHLNATILAIVE